MEPMACFHDRVPRLLGNPMIESHASVRRRRIEECTYEKQKGGRHVTVEEQNRDEPTSDTAVDAEGSVKHVKYRRRGSRHRTAAASDLLRLRQALITRGESAVEGFLLARELDTPPLMDEWHGIATRAVEISVLGICQIESLVRF